MDEKEIVEELLSLKGTYKLLLDREEERNKELKAIHERLDGLNEKIDALIEDVSEISKLVSLKTDMNNFKVDMRSAIDNFDESMQNSFNSFLVAFKEAVKKNAGNDGELVIEKKKVKTKKLAKNSVNPTAKDSTKRKSSKK